MGLITSEVEIIPRNNKIINYYKSKGYDAKKNEPLTIKVKDLQKGSNVKVKITCDYCDKLLERTYNRYNTLIQSNGKYACKNCTFNKVSETNLRRYGVSSFTCTEEFKEKSRKTNLEKYGFESYSQTNECKEKRKNTVKSKYGVENVTQNPEILKRMHETCIEKYGTPYPIQLQEFKEKIKQTCLDKFGVEYASQSLEIKEKMTKAFFESNAVNTSKQQLYLHNLYGGKLNFPINMFNADICFPNEKLVIEYNGGGHNLQVKLKNITSSEFERKEMVRNLILKKEGYKIISIISSRDKLPSDEILFQMLEQARTYFSKNTNSHWYEYNIDTSSVRNAEHKDGIFFNYGELRKIKKIA